MDKDDKAVIPPISVSYYSAIPPVFHTNVKVFVVVCEDRHIDVNVAVFSTWDKAHKYAQEFIAAMGYEDEIEEPELSIKAIEAGWRYLAIFSSEGDSVRIDERHIDDNLKVSW